MYMINHQNPESAALTLAHRVIANARRSAKSTTDDGRTGQHRAAIERAFSEMNRRGPLASSALGALGRRLPLLLMVDRGETLSSYEARMHAFFGLVTAQQPPTFGQLQHQLPKAAGDDHARN